MYTIYTCDFPLCFTGGIAAHCAEGTETPRRPREEGRNSVSGRRWVYGKPRKDRKMAGKLCFTHEKWKLKA